MIGDPSEAEVSGKHSAQVEDDQERRRSHDAEASAALFDGKRQIRWKPGEQAPPDKHSKEVQKQQCEGALEIRPLKNSQERIVIVFLLGLGDALGILR